MIAEYQAEVAACFEIAQRLAARNPTLPGAFTGTPSERLARLLAAQEAQQEVQQEAVPGSPNLHGEPVSAVKPAATTDATAEAAVEVSTEADLAPAPRMLGAWDQTTWGVRYYDALTLLFGKRPPVALVVAWLARDETVATTLQDWAGRECRLPWAQAIVHLDAAEVLADCPEEGEFHQGRRPDEERHLEADIDALQAVEARRFQVGQVWVDPHGRLYRVDRLTGVAAYLGTKLDTKDAGFSGPQIRRRLFAAEGWQRVS